MLHTHSGIEIQAAALQPEQNACDPGLENGKGKRKTTGVLVSY